MEPGWVGFSDYNRRVYDTWRSMISRCYNRRRLKSSPTYVGCIVCKRWLYLHNFVGDIKKIPNYDYWKNNPGKKISLDKDILNPGNRVYSLKNCQFVDFSVNSSDSISRNKGIASLGANAIAVKKGRPVCADCNGVVTEYRSITEATVTGVSRETIRRHCEGITKGLALGKYRFWYK